MIRAADADRVGRFCFVIEDGVAFELVAVNGERAVVGVAKPGDQCVGVRISRVVQVVGRKGAYHGTDRLVLLDAGGRQIDVRGRIVQIDGDLEIVGQRAKVVIFKSH